MARILARILVVTGVGSAIVIAMPGLVIFAGIALIVPGLILGMLPTAFLWTATFAAFWWALHTIIRMHSALAALIALGATAAVLVAIPAAANRSIEAEIAAERSGDIDPGTLLRLAGTIRIERAGYNTSPVVDAEWLEQLKGTSISRRTFYSLRCDRLCAAALFADGIDAVVLAPPQASKSTSLPARFWIEHRAGCTDSLEWGESPSTAGFGNQRALDDEWRAHISQGHCIRRGPAQGDAAFVITFKEWTLNDSLWNRNWSLFHQRLAVRRMEIHDGAGRLLLRRTQVADVKLHPVLWIGADGDLQSFHFEWARKRSYEESAVGAFAPAKELARFMPLRLEGDTRQAVDGARAQLGQLLADPTRPKTDPGFALPSAIFDDIGKNGLRDGDLDFVVRIIADPRTREMQGIWAVIKRLGDRSAELRGPIARRLLAAEVPGDREKVRALGEALSTLPAGLFATPLPEETALLADQDRRYWAAGLIQRQSDRGVEAVPLLLAIIEEGFARNAKNTRNEAMAAIDAARYALSVLGPVAAHTLPSLEAMLADGRLPPRLLERDEWLLTFARLGSPIESFAKPDNRGGTTEQFHERIRRNLAQFRPQRQWH
jgi:hypothetical protein